MLKPLLVIQYFPDVNSSLIQNILLKCGLWLNMFLLFTVNFVAVSFFPHKFNSFIFDFDLTL